MLHSTLAKHGHLWYLMGQASLLPHISAAVCFLSAPGVFLPLAGVAIWFPMGEANLRVVRLAPRESRLLNSRCAEGILLAVAAACCLLPVGAANARC